MAESTGEDRVDRIDGEADTEPDLNDQSLASRLSFGFGAPTDRDEWKRLFGAPETEELIEDFSCAVFRRSFPHHGRMYVSNSHLCFRSSIFGKITQMKIHFDEIVSLTKTTVNLINPGIEVTTWRHKHTFGSFVNRDKTLRAIEKIWVDCRQREREILMSNPVVLQPLPHDMHSMFETSRGDSTAPPAPTVSIPDQEPHLTSHRSSFEDEEAEWSDSGNAEAALPVVELDLNVLPPDAPHATVVIASESMPASPYQLREYLTGTTSRPFLERYMSETERSNLQVGEWKNYTTGSLIREVKYIQHGLKAPPLLKGFPKETNCEELQKFTTRSLNNFMIESSVSTPDVTYGDHFTVELRYTFTAAEGAPIEAMHNGKPIQYPFTRTSVQVSVSIVWIKSLSWMIKSAIEMLVLNGVKNTHKKWIELLRAAVDGQELGPIVPVGVSEPPKSVRRKQSALSNEGELSPPSSSPSTPPQNPTSSPLVAQLAPNAPANQSVNQTVSTATVTAAATNGTTSSTSHISFSDSAPDLIPLTNFSPKHRPAASTEAPKPSTHTAPVTTSISASENLVLQVQYLRIIVGGLLLWCLILTYVLVTISWRVGSQSEHRDEL